MVDGHEVHMRRALELAERGWGRVAPNPMVGAVIVRDGEVVGEGWHEGPGTQHAEVMALTTAGKQAVGATVFCTLEPCDHTGRTGPCTRALIDARVSHVVVAASDPNPSVDGRGFAALQAAGITVDRGPLSEEAHRLNAAYERHVSTGLPFVTLKMASTLDGKSAASDGTSRWITGEAARADVQRSRAWADAIVVGVGTALADDPALTLRDPRFKEARPPLRVVVDTTGRLAPTGRLFDEEAPTLVATTDRAPDERVDGWIDAGAEVLVLPSGPVGGVSLGALLEAFGKWDVQGLLVEGGPTLAWSFVREGLIDRVVVYIAPMLAGGATASSMVMGSGFAPIARAMKLEFSSIERIGTDLRVEADVLRDH
ncbi:MAG: bifunctional diaminohydroxyphosphoribosylaminopyrimidine deaminase/5-amino-6-(5-phosphoribosylamino)uracil reductase RibD [Actinomycetota bacterium]|nr:bifunctional diaminohydroxyphosphoribosylaminopyrimidine deaminase/5-amino-6-(5-phosphoribosylamino)uracil reductase RibD [Actinomycetota bacterium]